MNDAGVVLPNRLSCRTNLRKPNHDFPGGLGVVGGDAFRAVGEHINGDIGVDVQSLELRRCAGCRVIVADDVLPFKVDVKGLDVRELLGKQAIGLDVGECVHVVLARGGGRVLPGHLERRSEILGVAVRVTVGSVVVEEDLRASATLVTVCCAMSCDAVRCHAMPCQEMSCNAAAPTGRNGVVRPTRSRLQLGSWGRGRGQARKERKMPGTYIHTHATLGTVGETPLVRVDYRHVSFGPSVGSV